MASVLKQAATTEFGGTPYGNTLVRRFDLETNAAGVVVGGNSVAALGATDDVALGILRSGTRLDDALAIVSDAFRTGITGALGFRYVDGVDDTTQAAAREGRAYVPQDLAYFFAQGLATTVGRVRATQGKRPVTLPKDAYLVWTNAVNAHNEAGRIDFLIYGEDRGPL